MKIFLIGFMGCGKTTYGQKLAERLGFDFVDLDELVETLEGQTISEIFKERGEACFREIEKDCLRSLDANRNTIVATGGGTPCFFDNMGWMTGKGVTIYFKLSPEKLCQRLAGETHQRPLLKDLDKIELLDFISSKLMEREPFYEKAHLIFTLENDEFDVIEELRQSMIRIIGH